MRPLLIDEKARASIAAVVRHAQEHRYSKPFMLERAKNPDLPAPGDDAAFVCHLEFGFRCVYTIEEQPMGWSHHLSISVNHPKNLPSIPAVEMLMKEFGIAAKMEQCGCWVDKDITPNAVNVVAKI